MPLRKLQARKETGTRTGSPHRHYLATVQQQAIHAMHQMSDTSKGEHLQDGILVEASSFSTNSGISGQGLASAGNHALTLRRAIVGLLML